VGGIIFFYVVPPLFLDEYWLSVANRLWITIIAAMGLNLLTGYAGQISLGHTAFMAVGAYTSAMLTTLAGFPFWAALPCAGISAGVIGLVFGLPSLRVKGLYLILATLAAQFIIMYWITHVNITGGAQGLSAAYPTLGGITFNTQRTFYLIALGVLLLCTYLAVNIVRSKPGRAFVAIRDNDLAAEVMGISLYRYKLMAFFVGCFYAGLAGSLMAHWMGRAIPEAFTPIGSLWYLGYLIVGGMGTIVGPFLGTAFLLLSVEGLSLGVESAGAAYPEMIAKIGPLSTLVFGIIIALFLMFEPRGLAHRWQIIKSYYRLWPFAY